MERDFEFFDNEMYIPNFNSHAHVERDHNVLTVKNKLFCHFNSHAHVERDLLHIIDWHMIRTNFNSHAHVERDFHFTYLSFYHTISTHTLTWSVTLQRKNQQRKRGISTHTLTWSVTRTPYSAR